MLLTILSAIIMMTTCSGQEKELNIRPATQAGRFYEAQPQRLAEEVDSFLNLHSESKPISNLAALIVPHAGYYFSGNVAAAAYKSIDTKKQYKRVFLLGPSHHEWLNGTSVNNVSDYYLTPLGKVINNPLHFSRFFPRFKMLDTPVTPVSTLKAAQAIASEEGLKYIYLGNV